VQDHSLEAFYFGWTGDGHIGRLNISHAFYEVVGEDNFNGIAQRRVTINAQMAALELSIDKDWLRFKLSGFLASGDSDPRDSTATGFDTILDRPFFIGGPFSFYVHQGFNLAGTSVNFKQRESLVPDFRSSKTEGQSNFVNPGALILGYGTDADIMPKLKAFLNVNYIWTMTTEVTKQVLMTNHASNEIGWDCSLGMQWRPLLTDNFIVSAGIGFLVPGAGYKDIYRTNTRPVPGFSQSAPRQGRRFSLQRAHHRHPDLLVRALSFLELLLMGIIVYCARAQEPEQAFGPPTSVSATKAISETASRPRRNWIDQSQAEANAKSDGCLQCHAGVEPMHKASHVVLGCTDCHGGNPATGLTKELAHVQPRHSEFWRSSANPPNSNAWINHESPEFIRFVNPGDLRVAQQTCGLCHGEVVDRVEHSMMRHGAMLWGAALYNNGSYNYKNYRFGQAYGPNGAPLRLVNYSAVTAAETQRHGILPFIEPLPRFNLSNPGNILRVFEKGGSAQLSLGAPTSREPPGRPERRLSERGLGTLNRTDPVFLGLQKTRLHDPLLDFLGSNDHAGDYRSSGCSACHVVYANDRSPTNSAWWSKYGHQGLSFTADPTIPKNERGHPITHQFTRAIPSSQCMNCHMHQGNLFVNPYLGYTWWDQETDGELLYPKQQHNPTDAELVRNTQTNPEAAAARGLWGDRDFLERVSELNPQLKHTQFADYHGHGWIFRAVFKHDRKGNLLDLDDKIISDRDPRKFGKAVHLNDIHLAHGMHCGDCHFDVDVHGNGMLYGEPRNATAVTCVDCHGTVDKRPTLVTSGNAGQIDLLNTSNTAFGPRFWWEGDKLWQQSSLTPEVRWEIPQTIDTVDPASSRYNPKSAYAKTLLRDGKTWEVARAATKQMVLKAAAKRSGRDWPTII
jgi:hypothetical protein